MPEEKREAIDFWSAPVATVLERLGTHAEGLSSAGAAARLTSKHNSRRLPWPMTRKTTWAVGIPRHLKVYPADVQMIWPVAGRGRPRNRHVPDILSMAAETMLHDATWQNISWRTGTKGKLKAALRLSAPTVMR